MPLEKVYYYNLVRTVNDNLEYLEDQIDAIEASQIEPAVTIAAIPASTNITAVPASFADLTAVRTYLNDAGMVVNIENRLDAIEAKLNTLIANLKTSGAITA